MAHQYPLTLSWTGNTLDATHNRNATVSNPGKHPLSVSSAPEYAGDTSFAASFWRVCGVRSLAVDLIASPAMPAAARHRRDLARGAEEAIRTALARRGAATEPGTRCTASG